ncbi:endonuclease domain-containing protein, partial [Sphingobium yanoikuyae]|uniref:endonuclease domain-containing protein n=1 Tax=Sphingobium yanoikuyae TaxID=13690 RepID=UPI000262C203
NSAGRCLPRSGGGPAQPFKPRNTVRAKALRNTAPAAERLLWQQLRGKKLGYKFSRQMPVGPYFADFLCRELKLIVELDGESHDFRLAYDAQRTEYCGAHGYQILRFSNADVMGNLEGVVTHIKTTLAKAPPAPPASGRGVSYFHAHHHP